MDPDKPVDLAARPRPVGGPARPLPRARPHRRGARRRAPDCPTWSSPPTAPPSSTAGCSAPGSPIAERHGEAAAHRAWYRAHGFADVHEPQHINEGEGDFAVTASWLLAGRGFRSSPLSHGEAQEFFGRPVIGLDLVDPRYYHLDTALCVLDDASGDGGHVLPAARSPPGSRAVLARLFPDALIAGGAGRGGPRAERGVATAAMCCCRRRRWGSSPRCGSAATSRSGWI